MKLTKEIETKNTQINKLISEVKPIKKEESVTIASGMLLLINTSFTSQNYLIFKKLDIFKYRFLIAKRIKK